MHAKDPEDLGIELAESLDTAALYEEADGSDESLKSEALESFEIQFRENQNGIQHDLLETALHDKLNSVQTDPEALTKDQLESLARDYARDALYEYLDTVIGDDVDVSYSDLPDVEDGYFGFRDAIVDGYWTDTAQVYIGQYLDA